MAGKSEMPLRYLKGVGERRAEQFARLEIATLGDLIEFYPRGYEDWTSIVSIEEAPFDRPCCIKAVALGEPVAHRVRKGLTLYKFSVSDGSSIMRVTILTTNTRPQKSKRGRNTCFSGRWAGTSPPARWRPLNRTTRKRTADKTDLPANRRAEHPLYRNMRVPRAGSCR